VIGAICLVCSTAHLANVGVLGTCAALLRLSRPDPSGAPSKAPPAGAPTDGD